MAEEFPTNSNVQSATGITPTVTGEELSVSQQLSQVATATLQSSVGSPEVATNINKPMTISSEQFRKAVDLLNEQVEDIVEPPSDRTAAFKQVFAVMKDAIKTVETTGKIQVIAITASGVIVQQMSRLEQIRADTAKASERLRIQAEEDTKSS